MPSDSIETSARNDQAAAEDSLTGAMEAAAAETMQAIDAAAAAAEAMVALERHPDEPLVVSDDDAPESLKELKQFQPAKCTLLGLMGLPAAGKSTLCEKLRDVTTHDVKIVRFDDDLEATGALDNWAPEKYLSLIHI